MRNWSTEIIAVHDSSIHHSSPFHKHRYYELYLFLSGNVTLYTETQGWQLNRGDFFLIPPNVWHRAQTKDERVYERVFLNIPIESIRSFSTEKTNLFKVLPSEGSEPIIFRLDSDQVHRYVNYIDQIIRLNTKKNFAYDVLINKILMEILVFINKLNFARDEVNSIPLPPLIVEIISFVDRHLYAELTVLEISRNLSLSTSYVSRSFKRFMGITLQDYIISKRLDRATEELKKGGTVQEAANASGFENYAHFIRTFKKRIGISPGKYSKDFFTNMENQDLDES